jgi:hypothetical protein
VFVGLRDSLARSMRQAHRAGENVLIDYSGKTANGAACRCAVTLEKLRSRRPWTWSRAGPACATVATPHAASCASAPGGIAGERHRGLRHAAAAIDRASTWLPATYHPLAVSPVTAKHGAGGVERSN